MTDTNIISTTQFGQFAPEIDTSQFTDPTLSGIISQSSKMVSDYLGYTPMQETISNELKTAGISSEGDLIIFPQKVPVTAVSAIALKKGATSIDLTLVDGSGNNKYNIDYTQRHIRYPWGEITLQGVPIFTDFYALKSSQFYAQYSYTAGWTINNLPASIQEAAVLLTREILARRLNPSGASRISQGGISLEFQQRKGKSDLVKDAEKLLNPYRRVG